MGEPAPAQLPGPRPAVGAQREPPPGERRDHPVGRPGRGERGEHVGDRGRDLLVRVDHGGAVVVVDVADRQRGAQLAAGGGGAFRALQPAGQQVQLGLAHRALQPQQQPVVEVGQVVDAVAVDDQGVGQPGQLQQPGQVRRGAGQPGDLQPEDRADLAQAHPRDQPAEPVAALGRAARHAQVGVDHLDRVAAVPAQRDRLLGQARTGGRSTRCARGPAPASTGGHRPPPPGPDACGRSSLTLTALVDVLLAGSSTSVVVGLAAGLIAGRRRPSSQRRSTMFASTATSSARPRRHRAGHVHRSAQGPPGQQLGVDRGDLGQHRLEPGRRPRPARSPSRSAPPARRPVRGRRPGRGTLRYSVRAVQLAVARIGSSPSRSDVPAVTSVPRSSASASGQPRRPAAGAGPAAPAPSTRPTPSLVFHIHTRLVGVVIGRSSTVSSVSSSTSGLHAQPMPDRNRATVGPRLGHRHPAQRAALADEHQPARPGAWRTTPAPGGRTTHGTDE